MSLLSLTSARRTWGVLCWGDRLTAGFADVLRHSPFSWKRHSQAQLSFLPSWRWWRRWVTWRNEIYPSGFIAWVECVVVSGSVWRLPAVEGTDIHWGRRYWWRYWRVRWFRAVVVSVSFLGVVSYGHRRQDVKGIGRQVQIVQAWGTIGGCRPKP